MAEQRWNVTYRILKVNKMEHKKAPDMIREHAENIPRLIKNAAEKLADRFDFAVVEVVADSVDSPDKFRFIFESDDGTYDSWVVGRQ